MSGPGSMSVHSLIDKFSNPQSSSSSKEEPSSRSYKKPEKTLDDPGLLSLLGANVSSFPFSEAAYVKTIKLKTEQEKTKQDFYKLEIANKNLSILQLAVQAQVPSQLIPSMCVGSDFNQLTETEKQLNKAKPPVTGPPAPGQYTFPPPNLSHKLTNSPIISPGNNAFIPSHSRSNSKDLYGPDTLNANPMPPMQFRFGSGSISSSNSQIPTPTLSNRRPLSPAKVGASAVANLETPITPYKSQASKKSVPLHQRHFSMPVESSSAKVKKPEKIITNLPAQAKHLASSSVHSPLGLTPSIQVKPTPAQPLHKQSKMTLPPSQESMTSFQHIIQFHHWKPESPGQTVGTNPILMSSMSPFKPQSSHKRHKSSSEKISSDLPPIPSSSRDSKITTESIPESREDDPDITMNTSSASIEPQIFESSKDTSDPHQSDEQSRKFPHDILTPSSR